MDLLFYRVARFTSVRGNLKTVLLKSKPSKGKECHKVLASDSSVITIAMLKVIFK